MQNVGKNLEKIRKRLGYSRKYIAENICDESTIYRIEKGQQIPRLDVLQKICRKLNVTVDYILSLHEQDTSYGYINKLKKLCREFLYRQEFESIQYLIEESETLLEDYPHLDDGDFRRFIDWQKAILIHKIHGDPKKAKILLKKLLNNKIMNEQDIHIANSLALVLIDLEQLNDAYFLLKEGMKTLEKLPKLEDHSLYPRIAYNLGYIYFYQQEYDKCIDICHRLEYYLDSNHLFYSAGELYHLLGVSYSKKRDLENSYHYFDKAATIFYFENKQSYYIRATLALAEIRLQMNKYEDADAKLEEIKEKINSLDDSDLIEKYMKRLERLKERFPISDMSD